MAWNNFVLEEKKEKKHKDNTQIFWKSKPHYRFDCATSNRSYSPRYYIVKALAYYYHCYLYIYP